MTERLSMMMDAKRYLLSVLDTDLAQDGLLVAAEAGAAALEGDDVLPLHIRFASQISFAEPVHNTRLLPGAQRVTIRCDETYPGFESSPLKSWINL